MPLSDVGVPIPTRAAPDGGRRILELWQGSIMSAGAAESMDHGYPALSFKVPLTLQVAAEEVIKCSPLYPASA
jgi:hypothetical protein